ncbi:MAG: GNAT family N-acetyltransferase [Lachnospiraceae bacterium]|nr:GNAT family N-acetyltransferase [Lachnospiraceae bacterium]
MITIRENSLTVVEYLAIRRQVGWKILKKEQAKKALENSLYVIAVYEDDTLVGIGRIVGDGAIICYVQDLIVIPESQGKGIGSAILKKLIGYVEELRQENSEMMLCLMCAKGREIFYEKHGFQARPTKQLGPGMIQYLGDE